MLQQPAIAPKGGEASSGTLAVEAVNLSKVYPPDFKAVDDVSFSVAEGEVFGLLGPNGAGKTTCIKMITTLTVPTAGTLRVFGVDVLSSPDMVRGMLGYVPQSVSVDTDLTAYENLLIFSKLFYVGRAEREKRISGALEYMGLSNRSDQLVKRFSGGMMRRLEIAQALVNRPRVLFLDEPSIGLDVYSRRDVWESVKQLKEQFKTTIFITTHDMAEADELCDRLAIMDAGKIAASGTPSELKRSVGGDIVRINLKSGYTPPQVPRELGELVRQQDGVLEFLSANGDAAAAGIIEFLQQKGCPAESVSVNRPTLDDAFMRYTSARIQDREQVTTARSERRAFMRHSK